MRSFFIGVLFLLSMLSACRTAEQASSSKDFLEPGISLSLARARAGQIEDLHYHLHLKLDEGIDAVEGEVEIRFELTRKVDRLIVDFGGQNLLSLEVNEKKVEHPAWVADHLSIDGNRVGKGSNLIKVGFRSIVGEGGTALTRFHDPNDDNDYFYTLLVPGDAHLLFPCFDQPDLKARFSISLFVPLNWAAIANSPVEEREEGENEALIRFQPTQPISTYLVAFAAGPFYRIEEDRLINPMALYVRPSKLDQVDSGALFALHRESLDWLARYFKRLYPFDKFEFVLVPGFPYGGMEHPGAVFYRENVLAFETEPTARDQLRRSILIYHEVSHQWFGDFVTMKWFDDLWLKEGYATFMSYKLLEALQPETLAWKRFSQNVEPRAYQVERTRGTTAVYQPLSNLAHAKSAYGAIVYNKAPAVLRQLEFLVGGEAFREATRLFLERYAYGNATWKDLMDCCEEVSGQRLGGWSYAWIMRKGMPKVMVERTPSGGVVLVQHGVHDEQALWPFRTQVAFLYDDGSIERRDVDMEERETRLEVGDRIPVLVFANSSDFAYGRFPLDEASLNAALSGIEEIEDPFLKSLIYDTLWDMVKAAELAPVRYLSLALQTLAPDADPLDASVFLGHMKLALKLYLSDAQLGVWAPRVEARLEEIMDDEAADPVLRLTCFRSFVDLASTKGGLDRLVSMLEGEAIPSSITCAPRDRWNMLKHLIVKNHDQAAALFQNEAASDQSVDAERYRFEVRSAFPDPKIKEEYFGYFGQETAYAESWLEASLAGFNATSQQALTLPYLRGALEMSLWLKEHRKIFFLPRWLDSFITSRTTPEAAEMVNRFLEKQKDFPHDVTLKVLQSLDPLENTIHIRDRYAESSE